MPDHLLNGQSDSLHGDRRPPLATLELKGATAMRAQELLTRTSPTETWVVTTTPEDAVAAESRLLAASLLHAWVPPRRLQRRQRDGSLRPLTAEEYDRASSALRRYERGV